MPENVQPKHRESFRLKTEKLLKQKARAESIISLARRKAQMMVLQAGKEAAKIREQARQQGYENGYKEGRQQGIIDGKMHLKKEADKVMQRMKVAEEKYDCRVLSMIETLKPRIKELILGALGEILRREVEDDDELIFRTFKNATSRMISRDKVQLSANREDAKKIIARRDEIQASSDVLEDLEIIASDEVDKGGCIVNTSTGIIDSTIDSQMEVAGEIVNN